MRLFEIEKKWNELISVNYLNEIINASNSAPILFFKHSSRCSISNMALSRINNGFSLYFPCETYLINVLLNREVSNKLAEITSVEHQSPQVIIFYNKKVIYSASHNQIKAEAIALKIKGLKND